jgi:uncharacterized protein YjbI with pentapeptide repeats
LRQRGFPGCSVYDCFGAGQQVAQVTYGGRDWRRTPRIAAEMFGVFGVMRQLHELLWYLEEALTYPAAGPVYGELRLALEATERLTRSSAAALVELDVDAHRRDVNGVLQRASELVRGGAPIRSSHERGGGDLVGKNVQGGDLVGKNPRGIDPVGKNMRGADLVGKNLRGADLSGASLRGASLIGADLAGANLRLADFTGADLRGADLSGADLQEAIFLTQSQLTSAQGDLDTRLPASLTRPAHWPVRRDSQR